ncbi:LysR family transcriptional regulator [Kytococcus sp. Marseille-QA3725]
MSWTLTQLQTFSAVAESGSMHAAAVELGYTPGAVSQQMSALSRSVGADLFIRSGRGVLLSDTGRGFLPHARRVLAEDRSARRALAELHTGRATVRVGVFETAGAVACRPALRRAAEASPPVDLAFEEVDVEASVDAVRAGTVDVALSVHYELVPVALPADVVVIELLTEPFVEARSAGPGGSATWIVPPVTETFGLAAQAALRRAGEALEGVHVVTDTALMVALVEAGVGRALLTPLMLRVHSRDLALRPAERSGTRSVVALTTRAQADRPSVSAVVRGLREIFREERGNDGGSPVT